MISCRKAIALCSTNLDVPKAMRITFSRHLPIAWLSKDRLYIFRVNILREYKYSEDERRTVLLAGEINTGFAVNYNRFHIDDIYSKAYIKQKCNSSILYYYFIRYKSLFLFILSSSRYQRYFSELYFMRVSFYCYNYCQ